MDLYHSTGPIDCTAGFPSPDLSGKTAVVTGAASGIGKAYTQALVSCGCRVVIADINTAAGEELQKTLGENTIFSKCDITNWDDQLATFKAAIAFSPTRQIDIVVANAAVGPPDSTFAHPDADLDEPTKPDLRMAHVNGTAQLYTIKLALWYFRRQARKEKGDFSLVLQGSIYAYLDSWRVPEYAFAKFGLRGVMRSLRSTEQVHGIRTNLIAPWYVDTPLIYDRTREKVQNGAGEFATVEDAAAALLRIVGDKSVNGRAIGVLPREWKESPQGILDFGADDLPEGSLLNIMTERSELIAGLRQKG